MNSPSEKPHLRRRWWLALHPAERAAVAADDLFVSVFMEMDGRAWETSRPCLREIAERLVVTPLKIRRHLLRAIGVTVRAFFSRTLVGKVLRAKQLGRSVRRMFTWFGFASRR